MLLSHELMEQRAWSSAANILQIASHVESRLDYAIIARRVERARAILHTTTPPLNLMKLFRHFLTHQRATDWQLVDVQA